MTRASPILRSPCLQWLLGQVFPQLRLWPVRGWPELLARIGGLEFDRFERLGTLAGVVLVTWLLQPAARIEAAPGRVFLTQLLLSLPLLLLVVGPFFFRRMRRGLDQAIRQRSGLTADSAREGE